MASIEYTQIFTYTAGSAGATGVQYFQLGITPPAAGSIFVVKYLSLSSSSGITNTGPAWSVQGVTSDNGSGTNAHPFISIVLGAPVAANTVVTLYQENNSSINTNPYSQLIINQPYIGLNVNMTGSGTFTVVISYLVIPTTNVLYTNFARAAGTSAAGNISVLSPSTSTRLLKSLIVTNYTDGVNTYTVQPVILSSGTPVAYIGTSYAIAPYTTVCYKTPLYLYVGDPYTLGLNITGVGAGISWYVSYTQDPKA